MLETDIAEGQHDIPETDTMSEIPDIDSQPEIHEQNTKIVDSDHNEQSDDSALGCKFDDSDDEVLSNGIDEVLVGVGRFVVGENDQEVDELDVDDVSKGKKVRVVDLRKKGQGKFQQEKGKTLQTKGERSHVC